MRNSWQIAWDSMESNWESATKLPYPAYDAPCEVWKKAALHEGSRILHMFKVTYLLDSLASEVLIALTAAWRDQC